jgi:hypothetical protein
MRYTIISTLLMSLSCAAQKQSPLYELSQSEATEKDCPYVQDANINSAYFTSAPDARQDVVPIAWMRDETLMNADTCMNCFKFNSTVLAMVRKGCAQCRPGEIKLSRPVVEALGVDVSDGNVTVGKGTWTLVPCGFNGTELESKQMSARVLSSTGSYGNGACGVPVQFDGSLPVVALNAGQFRGREVCNLCVDVTNSNNYTVTARVVSLYDVATKDIFQMNNQSATLLGINAGEYGNVNWTFTTCPTSV